MGKGTQKMEVLNLGQKCIRMYWEEFGQTFGMSGVQQFQLFSS